MGGQNIALGGFFVHTSHPRATGRADAYGLRLEFPNDPWYGGLLYREIGADYDAAVGFTPALAAGVYPFMLPDLVKLAAAAGIVPGVWALLGHRR